MPLRRFRRQHEQLSLFERGETIGMMEAGWSARRAARQLDRFDCVVRRCWDQWIREMLFTRRPGSGLPQQISLREDCHIIRNARVQPTVSTVALQAQWCRARGNWAVAEWNQVVFSDESRFNLSNDDNRVRVWRHGGERLNPAFTLQRHTAPTAGAILDDDRGSLRLWSRTRERSIVWIRGGFVVTLKTHRVEETDAL
ncbi:transposable element Tcb2 transposase [Trichonephila clavipes]|uniref:Transposable element Tcb2 transposase n=1 Tax=Trichonephila clavipes TaxID=2585209 RepID=A0A8X6VYH5_TRICX|nr:transposable element Tcb2 transposase [Trichonephila clavipes]